MGGALGCFAGESLPPICDADLATPGPLKHAYQLFTASKEARLRHRGDRWAALDRGPLRRAPQGQAGKLDSRGFARAFRLREDVTLRRLLKLWDRDADGEVDFREFIVGIATWETYERGFGRLRLAFRLLDNDNDNLLGRSDLTIAAEAWDRALAAEIARAPSPTRGVSPTRGGGAAQQRSPPVPNPFVALQRELTETQVQAVDFRLFLTLEPRHPQICASANLIWSSLQPYAAAAAALVAKLRMEGHMDYLAEPKHLSGKLVRSGSGGTTSQRSSGQSAGFGGGGSGKLRGTPSRNVSGASSANNSGKISVPMLSLGGLQPPPPRGHQRTGSQARAMAGRADDDDLDGFADWAASHGTSVPAGRDEGGGYGDYGGSEYGGDYGGEYNRGGGGNAGWASATLRTASPTPPHLRRAHSPPVPQPHATWERSGSSNSLAGGASLRLASPSRGRLPPAVDPAARTSSPMRPPHAQPQPNEPLEPEIRSLMTVLASPHAATHRALGQSSSRIPSDYYARLDEVASSRRLNRSQTFS